jgi:hypothetical protein
LVKAATTIGASGDITAAKLLGVEVSAFNEIQNIQEKQFSDLYSPVMDERI